MINYQAGTNISKEDVRKQFTEALRSTGLIENAEIKIDDVINEKMIEWYSKITGEMKDKPIDVATTVRENAIKQKLTVIDPGTGDDYRINDNDGNVHIVHAAGESGDGGHKVVEPIHIVTGGDGDGGMHGDGGGRIIEGDFV